ncbi:MAG: 2-succinyl-5-enolpyruvyl-6-hydroxy-3-cyclohexene-1-carboxylic-acid synthase [Prevotella sp.]|nr:2-succinyl-5-enolpyruvyl-6-hydroxy-3-cyclohexene-1-carboxylic-acid synthase [Prevotella sp.]
MYSNKDNINILTSLLVAHHVRHAVVCPGARNAPIVHNLNECEAIKCYPVTDERSASFFALGLSQSLTEPVAVCVTSGSALLNLAPAVAEAWYQHVPLVIISADRPEAWIDQLDGQTLPQQGVLGPFVRKSVTLPEPHNDDTRWHCNRLVNEALLDYRYPYHAPVHINVPISEPLFEFTTPALPEERVISRHIIRSENDIFTPKVFYEAARPMMVVGQYFSDWVDEDDMGLVDMRRFFYDYCPVMAESLNNVFGGISVDAALSVIGDDTAYRPDVVVYLGGHIVSKRLKRFLRQSGARVIMISEDPAVRDVTMHATDVVVMDPYDALWSLFHFYHHRTNADAFGACDVEEDNMPFYQLNPAHEKYHLLWKEVMRLVERLTLEYEPQYSQMATVRYLEEQLSDAFFDYQIHYANSSAVRLANLYAGIFNRHHVWCNRGVNGIEGTLSTAVGFAAGKMAEPAENGPETVICVIGDLSFFYDQNALWNQNLGGNLRVILLNNGEGGIFRTLPGLSKSDAQAMVMARHATTAQGICTQCDVGYIRATNMQEMKEGIVTLLTEETTRPMVLEVITDPVDDNEQFQKYNSQFTGKS